MSSGEASSSTVGPMRDEQELERSGAQGELELATEHEPPHSHALRLQRSLGNRRLMQLRRAVQRRSERAAPEWMKAQLGISPESQASAAADELAVPSDGRPLPTAVKRQAEAQLGTCLDEVTVAHGADTACDSIGALAFTTPGERGGHTVALSSAVDLASEEGRFTLMHELAHVAQQQRGEATGLSGLGGDEGARAHLEDQADAAAARGLRENQERNVTHGGT